MVFNSNVFLFGFLPIVFTLFWLARTKQQRYVLLTVSGYVFYGWWDWRFCGLLLFSSTISFLAGLFIQRSTSAASRRAVLVGAIATDLSLLGFFKYYTFLARTIHDVLPGLSPPLLHVILPIGISFYTFHTISYVADVHARRVRATSNVFEYLAYVSLFSQLVAGPIVRFKQIEDDLEHLDRRLTADRAARGVGFFVLGMMKKVLVADSIATLIDPMLRDIDHLGPVAAWACALGYTFQLYFDFSGYSDMAIGLGHLFGVSIPQNFNAPYRADGIRDFWRRWHMSLSSWLRDYLYISLGGSRSGRVRTQVNLLVTMLLGGLWHGANWTFVLWGAYHGVLLVLERQIEGAFGRLPLVLRRATTFLLVVFGWVLFRAPDVGSAGRWFRQLARLGDLSTPVPPKLVLWVLACLVAVNVLPVSWDIRFPVRRRWAAAYAVGLFVCYLFMNGNSTVFLYYQF